MLTERLKFTLFIILVCLLFTGIFFIIESDKKTYKYTIVDSNNHSYRTLDYEKIGDCVKFTEQSTNYVIEICGTYQIKENKKYANQ